MYINNINLNLLKCQADNVGLPISEFIYRYFNSKQGRGKELAIRLINFYLSLSFKFRNLRLFHSLSYLAELLGVNKNYLCGILKELVALGILDKKRSKNKKTPEYFLSDAFKLPEVRYRLKGIFSAIKTLSLSLLFMACGYGAEVNVKRLADQSNGGDLNLYYKNYDYIINNILKEREIFNKKEDYGRLKSQIFIDSIWDDYLPPKKASYFPWFDKNLENSISAVLADHSDYVNKVFGDIPFYSRKREPMRNSKTPRLVLEADEVIRKNNEQREKIEAERNSEEAKRKELEGWEKLKRAGLA